MTSTSKALVTESLTDKTGEFPDYTQWETEKMCCCEVDFIPAIGKRFWGHWEMNLCVPIIVISLILFSFCLNVVSSIISMKTVCLCLIPLLFLFGFLFVFSYVMIIYLGPGYFPYYWSQDQRFDPKTEESIPRCNAEFLPSGIISTDSQYWWSRVQTKPPRSILARSARRIVVRPDHLCGWTTSWIGKRNMKQFILFNLYGSLFLLTLVVSNAFIAAPILNQKISVEIALSGFILVFAFAFFLLTASFCISSFANAFKGVTTWEQWNNVDVNLFRRSWRENLRDVFGAPDPLLLWFIPIDPWKGIPTSQLVEGFPSYYSTPV